MHFIHLKLYNIIHLDMNKHYSTNYKLNDSHQSIIKIYHLIQTNICQEITQISLIFCLSILFDLALSELRTATGESVPCYPTLYAATSSIIFEVFGVLTLITSPFPTNFGMRILTYLIALLASPPS